MKIGIAPSQHGLALIRSIRGDMVVMARAIGITFGTNVPSQTHGLRRLDLRHWDGRKFPSTNLLSDGAAAHCGHILEPGEDTGNEGSVVQSGSLTARVWLWLWRGQRLRQLLWLWLWLWLRQWLRINQWCRAEAQLQAE